MAQEKTIRCYCLKTREGKMHCPLSTNEKDLENTFNYWVRGEEIIWVDIDASFVCKDERKDYCKNCPFK